MAAIAKKKTSSTSPQIREIRILLIGDEGVGKSTLITSLIKETFVEQIQHVVPEVTIPPEWTRENITTRIVDSSSRPQNRDQLDTEIRKADVVCIIYAVDKKETQERLSEHWLPYIRRLGRNVPVVLVGNKIDTRPNITNDALEDQVMPIMNEFKEVETCVECSAKQPLNVSEVFYFAQKAVLHPTAPLYDSREHVLKPACIDALRRIFKLCDIDKNGFMDDDEIDNFQKKCFGIPLQKHELESVKQVVKENEELGVTSEGLSEIGFIFLHTLFIQKGRLETTWTVLRTFGYGDDLTLTENYLFPKFEVLSDSAVELSSDGYHFLTDLFQIFDKDNDGALNLQELDCLFSTAPSIPWDHSRESITNQEGSITLQGFLSQWSMTTLLDYKTTLSYMAYLGFFDPDHTKALTLKKRAAKKNQRDVFLCYVFGAAGSGKTSIMKSFTKNKFKKEYTPTTTPYSVVNSVEIGGEEKYLIMQEFGPNYDIEVLNTKMQCDLICMVYDSADANSFTYIATLREKYKLDQIPIVYIATKSDLDLVAQRYPIQPDQYCRDRGLQSPLSVSIKEGVDADLFNVICNVALNPKIATQGKKKGFGVIGVGAITVGVLVVFVGVWWRLSRQPMK